MMDAFSLVRYPVTTLVISVSSLQAQNSVAEWQAKAVKEYPALGERESELNAAFVKLYQEKKAGDPAFFEQVDWPWQLALQVAEAQGVQPVSAAVSVTTPAPAAEHAVPEPATSVVKTVETAEDQTAEWEADKVPDSLGLEFARFRWWAPGGVPIRGVLVLAPGRGGDGRGMANDKRWQAIAREYHFGIVGCFLKNRADNPFAYQKDPNGATSDLVNRAVDELMKENGHPLKHPPLFFYGHSAGGNVSQNYGDRYAKRMVGAVIMRCPSGGGDYKPDKGDVPMLIYIGGKDKREWVEYSVQKYEEGQKKRALWTLAMHPDEGHGAGNTWEVTEAFVNGVIDLRMGKPGPGALNAPKKLSRQQGWLGDPQSYEVGSASQFKGKKGEATWLPDEKTALLWQKYLKR